MQHLAAAHLSVLQCCSPVLSFFVEQVSPSAEVPTCPQLLLDRHFHYLPLLIRNDGDVYTVRRDSSSGEPAPSPTNTTTTHHNIAIRRRDRVAIAHVYRDCRNRHHGGMKSLRRKVLRNVMPCHAMPCSIHQTSRMRVSCCTAAKLTWHSSSGACVLCIMQVEWV